MIRTFLLTATGRRAALGVAWLSLALMLAGAAAPAAPTPDPRTEAATKAFAAVDRGRWSDFLRHRKAVRDPLLAKVLTWIDLSRPGSGNSFDAIAAFIAGNPDWPGQWTLQRRAEEAMPPELPDSRVIAWFSEREPVSVDGRIRYGAALLNTGRVDAAREFARATWIDGDFGPRQERQFLNLYGAHLTRDDHEARLDRLLWDDRHRAAKRLLGKVSPDMRRLAEARSLLALRKGGVDAAIARVPKELRDHPGLVYERLRWRRRKGRDAAALEMLRNAPPSPMRPDKWWIERETLARAALREGLITDAYRLTRDHGLEEGSHFAAAEFLAGWIALRFLNDHDVALNHFSNLYDKVSYPISRARAAYWSGRASEALGLKKGARLWYGIAARFPTTFYGQLAAARLDARESLRLPPDAHPAPAEVRAFNKHELVRIARRLRAIGQHERITPFGLRLANLSQSAGWSALTAELALDLDRPDLAVRIARRSVLELQPIVAPGYPTVSLPAPRLDDDQPHPEPGLVHALIRQESGFGRTAVSPAGARGLMQIMPATARRVARDSGLRYAKARLTSDADYNLILGQTYLGGLLERYDGSYVLALAAYNAGPSRVKRWIEAYGDPREGVLDPIDWIESVPFSETRNYLQRVLEALQVYRARLDKTRIALTLEQDLNR